MDIGIYIADLLRSQDEVNLPGLGKFAKERISGSYDPASNSFLPPSYKVIFIDTLSESNSLLDYIRFKRDLSLSSAEHFIKTFISGINELLESTSVAEVQPLGIFRKERENLLFEPSTSFDIDGKFYGLKPIADISRTEDSRLDEKIITVGDLTIGDYITQGDGDNLEEEHAEENKGNHLLFAVLGVFLTGILAAGLLYFFNPRVRDFTDRELFKSVSITPASSEIGKVVKDSLGIPEDSTQTTLPIILNDSTTNDSAMKDSTILEAPIAKKPEPVVGALKIEIIGATFGKKSEAASYVKVMKAKGFQAKIAEDMPGRLFKVSLASFNDERNAQIELNRIVREVEKTAWIAKYKSKKNH